MNETFDTCRPTLRFRPAVLLSAVWLLVSFGLSSAAFAQLQVAECKLCGGVEGREPKSIYLDAAHAASFTPVIPPGDVFLWMRLEGSKDTLKAFEQRKPTTIVHQLLRSEFGTWKTYRMLKAGRIEDLVALGYEADEPGRNTFDWRTQTSFRKPEPGLYRVVVLLVYPRQPQPLELMNFDLQIN